MSMSMSQMSTRKVLTLVMPRRQDRVLLGMKKRGFGQGRLVFVCWIYFLTPFPKMERLRRQGGARGKCGGGRCQGVA